MKLAAAIAACCDVLESILKHKDLWLACAPNPRSREYARGFLAGLVVVQAVLDVVLESEEKPE